MPRPHKEIRIDLSTRANQRAMEEFSRDLRRFGLNVPREMKFARLRIAMELFRMVKLKTPVDKGELRNKWYVDEHDEYVDVINNAGHAMPVEFGYLQKRRWVPGRWVNDKFVYDKNATTGMMLTKKRIKGRFMLRKSVKEISKAIPSILIDAFDNALRRAFNDNRNY